MDFLAGWPDYLIRAVHLVAAISWVGNAFYFMWVDSNLEPADGNQPEADSHLWMVQGGAVYQLRKMKAYSGFRPPAKYRMKFEALFTWLTGILLLIIGYYLASDRNLLLPGSSMSGTLASLIGLSSIGISWLSYDALWLYVGPKRPRLALALSFAGAILLGYFYCSLFTGRAAFIHMGTVFGTILFANLWTRILPAQQDMLDGVGTGRTPTFQFSAIAKRRALHNHYLLFPIVFIMFVNHYPVAYSHTYNWAILVLLSVLGMSIRHFMLVKKKAEKRLALVPAFAALLAVVLWKVEAPRHEPGPHVSFSQIQPVITNRCVSCHSLHPSDPFFAAAAGGVLLDSPEQIKNYIPRIQERVVVTKTMPQGNKTGMTDEERVLVDNWVAQGAPVDVIIPAVDRIPAAAEQPGVDPFAAAVAAAAVAEQPAAQEETPAAVQEAATPEEEPLEVQKPKRVSAHKPKHETSKKRASASVKTLKSKNKKKTSSKSTKTKKKSTSKKKTSKIL